MFELEALHKQLLVHYRYVERDNKMNLSVCYAKKVTTCDLMEYLLIIGRGEKAEPR